jgi:hypothetical protein
MRLLLIIIVFAIIIIVVVDIMTRGNVVVTSDRIADI